MSLDRLIHHERDMLCADPTRPRSPQASTPFAWWGSSPEATSEQVRTHSMLYVPLEEQEEQHFVAEKRDEEGEGEIGEPSQETNIEVVEADLTRGAPADYWEAYLESLSRPLPLSPSAEPIAELSSTPSLDAPPTPPPNQRPKRILPAPPVDLSRTRLKVNATSALRGEGTTSARRAGRAGAPARGSSKSAIENPSTSASSSNIKSFAAPSGSDFPTKAEAIARIAELVAKLHPSSRTTSSLPGIPRAPNINKVGNLSSATWAADDVALLVSLAAAYKERFGSLRTVVLEAIGGVLSTPRSTKALLRKLEYEEDKKNGVKRARRAPAGILAAEKRMRAEISRATSGEGDEYIE